jgi:hypothetical protein
MVFEGKDGFLFSCTYRTFAAISVGGRRPHTKAAGRSCGAARRQKKESLSRQITGEIAIEMV